MLVIAFYMNPENIGSPKMESMSKNQNKEKRKYQSSRRKPMAKYGFYSKRAASTGKGTSIWRKANGQETEVTHVDNNQKGKRCNFWKDIISRGEVIKFIRIGRPE